MCMCNFVSSQKTLKVTTKIAKKTAFACLQYSLISAAAAAAITDFIFISTTFS